MANNNLTPKMENFCQAVVKLGEYAAAYRVAYNCENMKHETAVRNASTLAAVPKIKSRIQALQQLGANEAIYGIAEAMRDAVDLHLADANELVQVRRINCRHCHGVDHLYQWKNQREYAVALASWLERKEFDAKRRGPKSLPPPQPNHDGGFGFRKYGAPHPDCPECDGEGFEDVKLMDSRKLTGRARKLYAGAKVTKNGIEVVTRNQDAALQNVMRALGMFTETVKLLPPGAAADGVPALPDDPQEASRRYQEWIKGKG